MKVALCQFDIFWEDKKANKDRIRAFLDGKPVGAEWVVFPEMTLTGFSMDLSKTSIDDEDLGFFRKIACENSVFLTFGGVIGGRNTSITIDPSGKNLAEYSKIHLFSYAGEDKAYSPGAESVEFKVADLKASLFICYDLRFPYLFWKKAASASAFIVIANWPATRAAHWRALLKARAVENQAFVIGVNRVGKDPKLAYDGGSLVVDPQGEVILDCGNHEGLFIAEFLPEMAVQTREKFPFQKDRIDAW